MPTITDLPYELTSYILTLAAESNLRSPESTTYTYGFTTTHTSARKTTASLHIRGHVPTDVQRWNAVSAFRHVNSTWHAWSLSFALKELYIRRWRGGETWLRTAFTKPTSTTPVVYQHPYKSVRSTARLFSDFPEIAAHVRRIWFNGIYRYDTINHIFDILHNCTNIRAISIPWTCLRYGTIESWERLTSFHNFTSLELLSVGLKSEITNDPNSAKNTNVLASPLLDFSNLRRLKISGETDMMPISDADLLSLSRTATNLREILVSNVPHVSLTGIASLIRASHSSLSLIDYTSPPSQTPAPSECVCSLLASLPKLKDLAISLPCIHPSLFAHANPWHETIRLRIPSLDSLESFELNLAAARGLIERKEKAGEKIGIEVSVGGWLCDVGEGTVHGGFKGVGVEGREGSVKGPYGWTGIWGEGGKGEWSVVGVREWGSMVQQGVVRV